MKIAFASCMCSQVFAEQPVWTHIAEQRPDYLVLLGDSIYLDINVPSYPNNGGMPIPPKEMDEDTFMQHIHRRYTEQLKQPEFVNLVRGMPKNRVFSIWDDHDFLWNDTNGADYPKGTAQRNKVIISTAFQEAFRKTLAQSLAVGSFPDKYTAPEFLNLNRPPLTYPSVDLGAGVWLHLSDGRTYRTKTWLISDKNCTLLGAEQRATIETAIKAQPKSVHLFASGSTLSGWKRYATDLGWLKQLAAKQRMLVLSGDIHRNEVDVFDTGGLPLHEATSSGAAVKTGVVVGGKQQNYGLLDINDKAVTARFFHNGSEETKLARTYDRKSWQSV